MAVLKKKEKNGIYPIEAYLMCYIISRYGVTMRIFPRNHSFSTKNFPKRKSLEKDVREVTFSENFPSVLNQ